MQLTSVEARVLGCLLEKERTTPENYPLSLHALAAACNQATNREPVLSLGERAIEEALDSLREKKLASVVFGAGARVQKYRHIVPEIYNFSPQESALLCVLLLRGPQTPGELRARAERLAAFSSLAEVEAVLKGLIKAGEPLVRLLPPRPGQKERRYVQLLAGEPAREAPIALPSATGAGGTGGGLPSRVEALEQTAADLQAQLASLRDELQQFRKQFE